MQQATFAQRVTVIALVVVVAALGWPPGPQTARADTGVIRVSQDGLTAWPCGTEWADACTLQTALTHALPGNEIWLRAGTYTPPPGSDRSLSFELASGVAIYGGFAGTEEQQAQRDWEANITVLSGDIGRPGDSSDNSYHVVTCGAVDGTAVLDGVTISGGRADGSAPEDRGGGLYNDHGSPTIANVVLTGNWATSGGGVYNSYAPSPTLSDVTLVDNHAVDGGGMFNFSSSPRLTGAHFQANTANNGGGLYNYGSQPVVINSVFSGNTASAWGGAVYNGKSDSTFANVILTGNSADSGGAMANHWASPTLVNLTVSGNTAARGGALYNAVYSTPAVHNSIVWANGSEPIVDDPNSQASVSYSDVEGGYAGTGNIDIDPQFTAAGSGDLRLRSNSPAVDAGDNTVRLEDGGDWDGDGDTLEPLPFDLAGQPRFFDVAARPNTGNGAAPIIDMGAYETTVYQVTLPVISR